MAALVVERENGGGGGEGRYRKVRPGDREVALW